MGLVATERQARLTRLTICMAANSAWKIIYCFAQECDDDIQEDDGAGRQTIFRVVRIPFKVSDRYASSITGSDACKLGPSPGTFRRAGLYQH